MCSQNEQGSDASDRVYLVSAGMSELYAEIVIAGAMELNNIKKQHWNLGKDSKKILVQSLSLLCLPHNRPTIQRQGVEVRTMTLFRKPASQEGSRLMFQNNHLIRFFYRTEMEEVRK